MSNNNDFVIKQKDINHELLRRLKQKVLAQLREEIRIFQEEQLFKLLIDEDPLDEDDLLYEDDLQQRYEEVAARRFYTRSTKYRNSNAHKIFEEDLNGTWLNESEFRTKYAMTMESFWKLHDLIKDHRVFSQKGKRKQLPSEYQLMVLLAFLRTEGDGMSDKKVRSVFCLSCGAAKKYKDHVITAIIETLYQKTVFWPDKTERREISRRFQAKWKLPNLVGVADGTLFPLAFRPTRDDAPDFHGRKHIWSLSTLIINDDLRRIRYFIAGWAGCAHDDRILSNSRLCLKADEMFSEMEYIIGDCAFASRWWMVPCYKKPPGGTLLCPKEILNKTIAKPRVTSEHTIGMLKGRFPFLRSIRFRLTEDTQSMKRVIRFITVSVILHNLLIGYGDEYEINDDDVSLVDAENELNRALSHVNGSTDARREQLKNYIMEKYHI
jgi:hypothetical protein